MDVRQRTEEIEHLTFAPWATFSDASRGRAVPEPQDPLRPVFQRDRDRVLHCKAFRRLKQKTQVFLSPEGDLYRTRLDGQPPNENGTQYGDRGALYEWVAKQEAAGCDRYILSLDQLLSGGLKQGAIFMATDYVTSPTTEKGKLVFGIGLGVITCLIRFFGTMNEGVSFAILLMNLLVPYIEVLTRQDLLGISKPKKNKGGAAK